jgi:hypothetical protein
MSSESREGAADKRYEEQTFERGRRRCKEHKG